MKMFRSLRVLLLFVLCELITSSAIPIWELLSHQEKIGQLMYLFLNLVDVYCKNSPIPDCEKVLTLYGTSNLINQREDILDLMDPYQRNAREILWSHVTNGAFELPAEVRSLPFPTNPHAELEDGNNYIGDYDFNFPDYSEYQDASITPDDPHPYAVRVPAPISVLKEENPSETSSFRTDAALLNYPHKTSNIPKKDSLASRDTPTISIPQSVSVTSIGNSNLQQNRDSRNFQKELISNDRMLITEERGIKQDKPDPRSHDRFDANKFHSVQNTQSNESALLRILKT